ncbi:uncharacterized protein PFLUO_LOCUS3205 [Penicillium psychrofluorescens]|uniref:uncharacterized protein n=1 Tax=Penicillium psychrofluorescens TaxID=3158075 RepID=UPI003CCD86F0
MLFNRFLHICASVASLVKAVEITGYEYVVVGSGAGGGPVAARLALAGHKTLLIEAGDDQGSNLNYSVPAFSAKASEDPVMSWNFFVRHYADEERQAKDYKTTYMTPDGIQYTGLNPPPNSEMLGTLYPRTQALGGCTAHNALVAIYPFASDFDNIVEITGDSSWAADKMREYFIKMENNNYLALDSADHGYDGWLSTEEAPATLLLEDDQLLSLITGGAFALGNYSDNLANVVTLLASDPNADTRERDTTSGFYQIPVSAKDSVRIGSRDFVVSVRDAKTPDGSKAYPLDVRTSCFATKITFDHSVNPPRATGVEFLDGKHLYRASPLSSTAKPGVPGSVTASREVIVAGGVYNSPLLLKHSGIGPAAELEKFGIPVVADLPGVGNNLQDHYEVVVQGTVPNNFTLLEDCTFGAPNDPCLERWENPILGDRGSYASNGFAATMFFKSTATDNDDWDVFVFGGPVNFRGYFPDYCYNITEYHNMFSWAILKSHPRNTAGSVTLRSADPLDMPNIVFNSFDTGSGNYSADLDAIFQAIETTRDAFSRQLDPVTEVLPGADIISKEEIEDYVKNTAWGHHASCTCPIGPDDDDMAVLDSSFRVRKVSGLRVTDASVYPRIPGTFTAISTYMVGEKAAAVILEQISSATAEN